MNAENSGAYTGGGVHPRLLLGEATKLPLGRSKIGNGLFCVGTTCLSYKQVSELACLRTLEIQQSCCC